MRNDSQRKEQECFTIIGSVTQAMQAQRILNAASVRTELVKADSSITGRGCAYALLYPCVMENTVLQALQNSSIRVRKGRR